MKPHFSDYIEAGKIDILWSEFKPVLLVFIESASLMNEGDPKNREHWTLIIITIPEILSADHNRNQATYNRIVSKKNS